MGDFSSIGFADEGAVEMVRGGGDVVSAVKVVIVLCFATPLNYYSPPPSPALNSPFFVRLVITLGNCHFRVWKEMERGDTNWEVGIIFFRRLPNRGIGRE